MHFNPIQAVARSVDEEVAAPILGCYHPVPVHLTMTSVINPKFPLASSRRVIGGEFDRQIELLGLIP
jgi:hypothetical protein